MINKYRVWDEVTKVMTYTTNLQPSMRYSGLKDKSGKDVIAGDIRFLYGKVFVIVDDGWRFRLERNLIQFGEDLEFTLDEDYAWDSRHLGNIHEQPNILIDRVNE